MSENLFHIDAFTSRVFSGNPAAVLFVDAFPSDKWMQAFAAEMNLSETAFVKLHPAGVDLRWFTPAVEVDLCGHATLATAHAMWESGRSTKETIQFQTRSGTLSATKMVDNHIELDFPATPVSSIENVDDVRRALNVEPVFVGSSKYDLVVVVDDEEKVRSFNPDFSRIAKLPYRGVMLTSKSDQESIDFVSRFFAPASGIDEDPVTGSAHCCLVTYWAEELKKKELHAYQASRRGGHVSVAVRGKRAYLRGEAVTVFSGTVKVGPNA